MIDKKALTDFIATRLADSDIFIVEVNVTPSNDIVVELDSPSGIDIDTCASLSRDIEEAFPRDEEDYSLEVGGAGLTSPFKVRLQFIKNIGNTLEILTADSRKLRATLLEVGDGGIKISYPVKVKTPGEKKPHMEEQEELLPWQSVKKASLYLEF